MLTLFVEYRMPIITWTLWHFYLLSYYYSWGTVHTCGTVHLVPRAPITYWALPLYTLYWPCYRENKWYLNYIGFGQELWAPTLTRLAHLIQCVLKYNPSPWASSHGLINWIDTKQIFIKLTCKGTLRQVLFRVLWTGDPVSHVGFFSTQLCELLSL
jgi:hypothetical protein